MPPSCAKRLGVRQSSGALSLAWLYT